MSNCPKGGGDNPECEFRLLETFVVGQGLLSRPLQKALAVNARDAS